EYSAVLRALYLSSENKVKHLLLKTDSEILVKQLSGLYKVRSPNIKKLYEECKKWEAEILQVQFQHVRREQNKRADELANLVLDGCDISNDTDSV
ncbi:MAG: reverse transcriptase-like protein, partial [Bdellovibrionales bacterium]|nr:reverse transcriptase-like protein [Bdellovibrionales bacterium]